MRKIIREETVYKYNELNDAAKEKVRAMFLEWRESFEFEELCKDILHYDYGLIDFSVQFSLGYCQGDGLNIYGELTSWELEQLIGDKLSKKELNRVKFYLKEYYKPIIIPCNRRYCYDYSRNISLDDVISELECERIRDIDYDTISKVETALRKKFHEINQRLEKLGYDFFYDIGEEEIVEMCEANEYEFLSDGTLF